jgi:uncharacterized protein (DUF1778 family)
MANTTTINLRTDESKRALIDRAAQVTGKNRSEFMLEAACREATSVLLDRRFFVLDSAAYKQFNAALDKPPADNQRLRRTLTTKPPWQR